MLYDERWDRKPAVDECGQMLLRAADYIEKHGWCQHEVKDAGGRVCVLGAVMMVDGFGFDWMQRVHSAAGIEPYDKSVVWPRRTCVADWNNAEGRTKQEVVDVLRRAAYTEE